MHFSSNYIYVAVAGILVTFVAIAYVWTFTGLPNPMDMITESAQSTQGAGASVGQ